MTMSHPRAEAARLALRAIQDSLDNRGFPPTKREISTALGWASSSQGHRVLEQLEAAGLITYQPHIPRSSRITATGMKALTEEL